MVTLVKVIPTGWKETSRGLKKSARTRTIKTSCELPAGAGKFPPVTRRNRRQLVPAEIFACILRYFYLRISLPAAFAGNFARASFTVHSQFSGLSNWCLSPILLLESYVFPHLYEYMCLTTLCFSTDFCTVYFSTFQHPKPLRQLNYNQIKRQKEATLFVRKMNWL